MDSQIFAGPVIGIFCSGLSAYCMQTRPLFLRISGSSGVLKAFLLERNRQLSCNQKKKKKKKKKDSTAGKPALAADSSPKAWHPESWGVSLSPSPVALAGLRPDLSSGPARVGIQVDSLHASQPSQQGSSQLRPTRLTAWMAPSRGHRQHWSQRQRRQQTQQARRLEVGSRCCSGSASLKALKDESGLVVM